MSNPVYRANVTDQQQTAIEDAAADSGSLLFVAGKTRINPAGNGGGAPAAVQHGSSMPIAKNAGVVTPWNDRPGAFLETQIGKA